MSPRSAANDQGEPATAPPALGVVPRLVPLADVAALLTVCDKTVERFHAAGKIPAPRKLGRSLRWDRVEIEEWLSRPDKNGELMDRVTWMPVWASLVRNKMRPSVN